MEEPFPESPSEKRLRYLKYYQSTYPFETIWKWIGSPTREFGMTFQNEKIDRWFFFSDAKDFKKQVEKKCPLVIHIGSEYTERKRSQSTSSVVKKELLFDIDLPDFPRKCCKEKSQCCNKCWPWIEFAAYVLERLLYSEFGYKRIFTFYSGMKGLHCWVCDENACKLTQLERECVLKRISSYPHEETTLTPSFYERARTYSQSMIEQHSLQDSFNKNQQLYGARIATLMLMWPILDRNVTPQVNRLIKSPFCLHHISGRVAFHIKKPEDAVYDVVLRGPRNLKENMQDFYNQVIQE